MEPPYKMNNDPNPLPSLAYCLLTVCLIPILAISYIFVST